MIKKILSSVFASLLLISCNNSTEIADNSSNKNINKDTVNERLITANKLFVGTENEMIDDFIKRYNWNMNISASGLRYKIYKKNSNIKPKLDNIVTLSYTTRLLNGNIIYSSDENGLKVFTIGKAEAEKGLEEGVKLMCLGEKAKFIIPSYLAFGLIGDQSKIPRNATLIYDVELLKIESNNSNK